jgi:3-phosphoshikimate 1-carboxyvinyltransferase
MRRVTRPLAEMGAQITELGESGRLPVRIDGAHLRPFSFVSEQASAQVKSALLLAALVSGVAIDVREPSASRDHTERMLRAMGAPLDEEISEDGQHVVLLEPADELVPLDITIPGDFSSAAFLIVAALLGVLPAVRLRESA